MSYYQKILNFRISVMTKGLWKCISQHHLESDSEIKRFRQISREGVIDCDLEVLRMSVIDDDVNDYILDGSLDMKVLTRNPRPLTKKTLITFLIIFQISCLGVKNEIFKFGNFKILS